MPGYDILLPEEYQKMQTKAYNLSAKRNLPGLQIVYTSEHILNGVAIKICSRFIPGRGFRDAFPYIVVEKPTEQEAIQEFRKQILAHLTSIDWPLSSETQA